MDIEYCMQDFATYSMDILIAKSFFNRRTSIYRDD